MTKEEKRNLLVHHTTRLSVAVQGCSNHGCAFNENNIGTNMICSCGKNAKELHKLIGTILDESQ